MSGVCIWFTGLPCSGKTTIAKGLLHTFANKGNIVTLLDGDDVRQHLTKGLGFSKEDRDTNVARVAWVASLVVKHQGLIMCSLVSPYRNTRALARSSIERFGGTFIEVFVDTPLEVCEKRDVKGMYLKARKGEILNFTGVSDPYESPVNPEIRLNTEHMPESNIVYIYRYLRKRRLV